MREYYIVYQNEMLCDEFMLKNGIPTLKGLFISQESADAYKEYLISLIPKQDKWRYPYEVSKIFLETDIMPRDYGYPKFEGHENGSRKR